MPRTQQLRDWIAGQFKDTFPGKECTIEAASSDASFRRYFRITLPDGTTRIAMDAPPGHEDCAPFVKVAQLLHEARVHAPEVLAEDLAQGFLLLTDLGRTTYLEALQADQGSKAPALYRDANTALIAMQRLDVSQRLPVYDRALLERELALFPQWYIERHLGLSLDAKQQETLQSAFGKILDSALAQPRVFVHRDYHSRNLMHCADRFPANPGVLDFQDAVYGPLTYDLVSLYRDAYIDWEEDTELDFVIRYWEMARKGALPVAIDFHDFYRDYEWMGVQRQLKVLGIFARLCHRDGKDGYLQDMPRVMHYLRRTAERYIDLRPLARLLDTLENRQANVGYTF